jgi:hypothetical protein
LHEELAYDQEQKKPTPHPSIYQLKWSDDSIDCQVLFGAVAILNHVLRLSGAKQILREGIFRIASREIDVFLDMVTQLELRKVAPQLPCAVQDRQKGEGRIEQADPRRYLGDVMFDSTLPAGLHP